MRMSWGPYFFMTSYSSIVKSVLFAQHAQKSDWFCNSCQLSFTSTLVTYSFSVSVSLHQMAWKPSRSSSGQNSVRKTSSSGWPAKNTRPLILRRSCCPKPNIFIQYLLNRRPLKRYGVACLFFINCIDVAQQNRL